MPQMSGGPEVGLCRKSYGQVVFLYQGYQAFDSHPYDFPQLGRPDSVQHAVSDLFAKWVAETSVNYAGGVYF